MKYIRLYEERLKDFEIMVGDPNFLIDELKEEINKRDYDLDYIRDLVVYGHFDINKIWINNSFNERTFLMEASGFNKADIVKILLEEGGANPNVQNILGYTALIIASIRDNVYVVEEMLKHPDIDINIMDIHNNTALHYACYGNNSEIVQILLSYPNINKGIINKDGQIAWDIAGNKIRQDVPQLKPIQ